jgi:hypothetical protein
VLICSERKELVAGDWFVLREKYYWLVANKPNEQGSVRWMVLIFFKRKILLVDYGWMVCFERKCTGG